MTPELTALALAGLLQAVQYAAYSLCAIRQAGLGYAVSPRDTPRALTGTPGRLQRAMNNHFEALILFTLAVVVVTLSGQASAFTAAMAWTYLAARILYVPAYVLGLAPWRSVIWFFGFLPSLAMILAALV